MVERVDHTLRLRYRQQRQEILARRHWRLSARLREQGYSALEVDDAVEDAERERLLDLVGLVEPDDE